MVLYLHIRTLVAPGVPVVSDSERSPPGTKTGLQLWLLLDWTGLRSGMLTIGCQKVPGTTQANCSELLRRGEVCGTQVAGSHQSFVAPTCLRAPYLH